MKAGFHSLTDMAAELERQNAVKADYVVDTREMTMLNGTELHLPNGIGEQSLLPLAHGQIASRLKVPKRYYDRLLEDHPDILLANVNGLFEREPKRHLFRAMDGNMRAMLSDRYRRIDDWDILKTVYPILHERSDLVVHSATITEKNLFLKALLPGTQAEVKVFILDNLWQSLPRPPFTDQETGVLAGRVYDYVWQRSASGGAALAA